jgi:uncharacterized protein (TIGR00730 family)
MSKTVAVFAGSRDGTNPQFNQQAFDLGQALAERRHKVLWGGGFSGVMGALSQGVESRNGAMEAFIASQYFDPNQKYPTHVLKTHCCSDDSERNAVFAKADFQIAMAGGIGSLLEIVYTLNHKVYLDKNSAPLAIVSTEGFYSQLRGLLEGIIDNGFNDVDTRSRFFFARTSQEAIKTLRL